MCSSHDKTASVVTPRILTALEGGIVVFHHETEIVCFCYVMFAASYHEISLATVHFHGVYSEPSMELAHGELQPNSELGQTRSVRGGTVYVESVVRV